MISESYQGIILGYSQFPGGPIHTDGIVLDPRVIGSRLDDVNDEWIFVGDNIDTGYKSNRFDRGRTLVHEMGHYFNLRHIWGDKYQCNASLIGEGTDYVKDTPTQFTHSIGCPIHPSTSCMNNDLFMNFMDYTDDNCMNMFTRGQVERARSLFEMNGFRYPLLLSSLNLLHKKGYQTNVSSTTTLHTTTHAPTTSYLTTSTTFDTTTTSQFITTDQITTKNPSMSPTKIDINQIKLNQESKAFNKLRLSHIFCIIFAFLGFNLY